MKLSEAMPYHFMSCEYDDVHARKFSDVEIVTKHTYDHTPGGSGLPWPGVHKNVFVWVELVNGYAVGWNENFSKGWSFPVMKIKKNKSKEDIR